MRDEVKTNAELLAELEVMRQRLAELELAAPFPVIPAQAGITSGAGGYSLGDWKRASEQEEHYRAAVDNVTDAIVINVGTTRVFVNNAFLSLHGLADMSQADGLALDHFIVPEDKLLVRERTLARQRGEPVPGLHRYRIRRSDGEVRTVESSAVAITFDGQPATLAVLRDITERNQAEDRVRRLAEIGRIINSTLNIEEVYEPFAQRVRDLIPFERIVITIADPSQGLFTTAYVSGGDVAHRRAGDVANLSNSLTQEVIRTRSGLIIQPKNIEDLKQSFVAPLPAYQAGFRSFLSVPLISHDEVIGVLHLESTKPEAYTERDLNLAESVGAHISGAIANARLFEQLELERERLRWLTMQVVSQEEEERHRVSRELHDEAGQALTALKIGLGLIHSDIPEELGPVKSRLAEALDLTDVTMENIRLLARGLRPPELDAVGLNGTLEGYCREFAGLTNLSIDYSGVEASAFTDAVNISFYRFLQEALTNVVKHAEAKHVKVRLDRSPTTISLAVTDDGRGFSPQALNPETARTKGIGLLGMQERFELLGGQLEVASTPGEGARLVAQAPSHAAQAPSHAAQAPSHAAQAGSTPPAGSRGQAPQA